MAAHTDGTSQHPIGLMILPWVTLFPGSMLPLHIFEPRYREMLANSLREDRMIGIAHSTDDTTCEPFASLGVIRACVANTDGTSNLILQGLSRIQLSNIITTPYPRADYQVLPEPEESTEDHEELHLRILSISIRKLVKGQLAPESFEDYLVALRDASAFTDAVSAAFVGDPIRRREIFLERDIHRRLKLLLDYLENEPTPEIEGPVTEN